MSLHFFLPSIDAGQCRSPTSWQFWMGRLRLLDRLLSESLLGNNTDDKEFNENCALYIRSKLCSHLPAVASPELSVAEARRCDPFKYTLQVVLFSREAMDVQHLGVTRLARRVFLHSGKLAVAWGVSARCLMKAIVDRLSSSHRGTMKSRLQLNDELDTECSGSRVCKRQRSRSHPFTVVSPTFNRTAFNQTDTSFYVPSEQEPKVSVLPSSPVHVMTDALDAAVEATRPHPVTASSVESSLAPSPDPGSASTSRSGTSMSSNRSQGNLPQRSDFEITRQMSNVCLDEVDGTEDQHCLSTDSKVPPSSAQQQLPANTMPAASVSPTTDLVRFAIGEESDSADNSDNEKKETTRPPPAEYTCVGEETNVETQTSPVSINVEHTDSVSMENQSPGPSQRHRGLSDIMESPPSSMGRFDSGIEPDSYGKDYCSNCAEMVDAEVEATTAATEASLYEVPLPPLHGLAPPDELVSIHEQPVVSFSSGGYYCMHLLYHLLSSDRNPPLPSSTA